MNLREGLVFCIARVPTLHDNTPDPLSKSGLLVSPEAYGAAALHDQDHGPGPLCAQSSQGPDPIVQHLVRPQVSAGVHRGMIRLHSVLSCLGQFFFLRHPVSRPIAT